MPHAVGTAGVRGPEPPFGGASIQLRNTLCVRLSRPLEVAQGSTVHREILIGVESPLHLVDGQQENLAGQSVGAGLVCSAGTAALPVRDLNLSLIHI